MDTTTPTRARAISPRLTALLLLLVAMTRAAFAASGDSPHGVELTTPHYSIYVEALDAEDFGRMLESFHAQMTTALGKAPPGRLRVELYADERRYHDALVRDDIGKVESGGFYSLDTRKAYLFVQPSAYFTRQLALHECAHQFHYLARTNNRQPRAKWYIEGLAEHFGTHNWDGRTLTLATVPQMTLEDYPAKALAQFTGPLGRDLAAVVTGKAKVERPVAWAVTHWLSAAAPDRFRALTEKLDALADPRVAWKQAFGGEVTAAQVEQFEHWLRANQQPWQVAFVEWQQRGDLFEGASDTTAVALLKRTPAVFEATVERADDGTQPGVVFGYASGKDHHTFQLQPGNRVRIGQRVAGKWQKSRYFDLPPRREGATRDVLTIEAGKEPGAVVLSANGVEVATVEASGQVGLYVQEGRAAFRVGQR